MPLEEQAQIFSEVPSPIFVSWYLAKKELSRMLIHLLKIFNR